MGIKNTGKLNALQHSLPDGLLVDTAWLNRHGYGASLRAKYLHSGWLEKPAPTVFRRPGRSLEWQNAVISLQSLLQCPLTVGGRTALELQGFAHNLAPIREVHLYGPKPPPSWLKKLPLNITFAYHNSERLFGPHPLTASGVSEGTHLPWANTHWTLTLSGPERALLETLDLLPAHESFTAVDQLMEGLTTLRPKRLQTLLEACRSVKVKRLFFFFADRHQHAWLSQLDRSTITLGTGKRSIVPGGKFNAQYQITVPENLSGVA